MKLSRDLHVEAVGRVDRGVAGEHADAFFWCVLITTTVASRSVVGARQPTWQSLIMSSTWAPSTAISATTLAPCRIGPSISRASTPTATFRARGDERLRCKRAATCVTVAQAFRTVGKARSNGGLLRTGLRFQAGLHALLFRPLAGGRRHARNRRPVHALSPRNGLHKLTIRNLSQEKSMTYKRLGFPKSIYPDHPKITFVGRLGTYRHMYMDATIRAAPDLERQRQTCVARVAFVELHRASPCCAA